VCVCVRVRACPFMWVCWAYLTKPFVIIIIIVVVVVYKKLKVLK
jgi:hypothetical protein